MHLVCVHTDDFKRKLVPDNRIYSWRGDLRFQSDDTEAPAFTPVEITDASTLPSI
jgi:hypothetical protein